MSGKRTFSSSEPSSPSQPGQGTPAGLVRIRRGRFENRSSLNELAVSGPSSGSSSTHGLGVLTMTDSPSRPDNTTTEPDEEIQVPLDLESAAALLYIGLSANASNAIYHRWSKAGTTVESMDFRNFAQECIAERALQSSASSDMRKTLEKLGASNKLVDQLMTPGHDSIRNTKTALQWLEEMMDVRWEYLQWGREASNARANTPTSSAAQSPLEVFKARQASKLREEQEQARKVTAKNHPFTPKPGTGPMPATQTADKLGYTTLYKGTTRVRAERMWSHPCRRGPFAIRSLRSKSPGDFSGNTHSFSFAPQIEGAQLHTRFCKTWASDVGGVCIVTIEVPNEVIEGVGKYILTFPEGEFKSVVWNSRKGNGVKVVNRGAYDADLLIGDSTTGIDGEFMSVASASEIEEKNLIKTSTGERVTQYVFTDVFEGIINGVCEDRTKILHSEVTGVQLLPIDIRG
ncbi:hypothetical protein CLAFUW4_14782 [Fulvia fulva]|uniref:Uncharacterized protein n=1 Tax=Passalora fulva TaxID=5499 RepID=A0A9Q8UWP3_PASFU|nr:uncharacterized protein CLAFUR5_14609 [Fulvia fulva]KAK4608831.1 hypothetical protein CLAFUR4_14793 [Fulvia fulva]KAK4609230.1 hypothetical protein CLAFUR4_14774 [Fulvia fulva]KAK4609533.1 hypothetical protein CLAFUR0_14774 [Fulvia fulva]UJO25226.1 hypothetical protein CLAFUR5_14609 [Fulvia fulva]WPV22687.1 hypothetical protein CLAFUW4_14782 [Fulvia fulva]